MADLQERIALARCGITRVQEQTRRRTALHEAAHAVYAHNFGERVDRLWLHPTKPEVGFCQVSWQKRKGKTDTFAMAVQSLAGHEAEVRVYKRNIHHLPATDYDFLKRLGLSDVSITLAGETARGLLKHTLPDIKRVQRALLASVGYALGPVAFREALRRR